MIFIPQQDGGDGEKSPLQEHIAGQISGSCEPFLADSGQVDDLAHAVAEFVEHASTHGSVESDYLVMLASQALSSIGESNSAHRLLLMGTGLMRPAYWEVSGGDAMWILDLKEMTVRSEAALEIVFFNSLSAILDMIAEVWDDCEGRGALGLRNVSPAAAALLGQDGRHDQIEAVGEEIKEMCMAKLDMLREQRRWLAAPAVLDLDLSPNY